MIDRSRFNIYLMSAICLGLACSCQSPQQKRKRALSTLELHVETNAAEGRGTELVPIYRQSPVSITVQKQPFLTAANVAEAKVLDAVGGFILRVQFDRDGTLLLEQYTSANRGRHMAIFAQFADVSADEASAGDASAWSLKARLNEGRWLAAPRINQRITDGVLAFTPDATRQEAEQIAIGLNNVVKKLHGKKPVE